MGSRAKLHSRTHIQYDIGLAAAHIVSGPTELWARAMLDQAPFKVCTLAVEVSGDTNRWVYFPNCNVKFKSIIPAIAAPEYRVSGEQEQGLVQCSIKCCTKKARLWWRLVGIPTRGFICYIAM